MNALAVPVLRTLKAWYHPGSAQGIAGLQIAINGLMLSALIFLHAHPWVALAVLIALFAATVALQGRDSLKLLALFGAIGWAAEAWIVAVGGVWGFAQPTYSGLDGGFFGVPFFMAPAWAMTGALMLALASWLRPNRHDA